MDNDCSNIPYNLSKDKMTQFRVQRRILGILKLDVLVSVLIESFGVLQFISKNGATLRHTRGCLLRVF